MEGLTKHFSWHAEFAFQENDSELRTCISEAVKKPTVSINKEPRCVVQNWDKIMAFITCETNVYRELHTAGDLSDPVQQGNYSYQQTPRNKGKGSSSAPKTSTKKTLAHLSATEQGTLLQQNEGDKDSGHNDTGEDRNYQLGQPTGRNDPDDSGSDSSNNSRFSGTSSLKSRLQPCNNNQQGPHA